MTSPIHDLALGLRSLAKRPAFTAVAVLALAVGIGLSATIFSLLDALLLRPPVAHAPERLVDVHAVARDGSSFHAFSYLDFQDYAEDRRSLDLAAWTIQMLSLAAGDETRVGVGQLVSGRYFEVFGVTPRAGRFFTAAEGTIGAGGDTVAVISDGLAERLGGASSIVGQTIRVNDRPLTVVGVAPPGFRGSLGPIETEVWLPLGLQPIIVPNLDAARRGNVWLEIVGRLAPGVGREQAGAALAARHRALADAYPESHSGDGSVEVRPFGSLPGAVRGGVRAFMTILMGLVGLLLLVTCVNVAGMLVARAVERRRELALRLALGASRQRLVGQLATETLLLFGLGGVAGLAVAHVATRLLASVELPVPIPLGLELGVDLRLLAFTVAVTFGCGLAFAVLPAMQSTRVSATAALGEDGHGGGRRRLRLRSALVVAQTAVALLLLTVAGLFLRSLHAAAAIDPGFDPAGVHLASIDVSLHGYGEARGRAFYQRLRESLAAAPGVEAVSFAHMVPLGLANSTTGFNVDGQAPPDNDSAYPADLNTIGEDYFRTMGIRLLAGRGFGAADRPGSPPAAVVNETLARRFWPGESALGRRLLLGPGPEDAVEIVGIAADGKYRSLGEDPRFFIYLPSAQSYRPEMTLLVRATAPATSLAPVIRQAIRDLDRHLPVAGEMLLAESMRLTVLPQRIASAATGIFGVLGLMLVAVGVYGVAAHSVSQRTRELGIRFALGARRRDVLGLILSQGLRLAVLGIGLGIALAVISTRAVRSLLFGISATDPLVLATTAGILAAVVLAGCLAPAWRAARTDPQAALRHG